ncbi:MAG: putative Ig domain-containing protein, partial [Acidobacteria bacterium]|nr:putative Ig domain-containing protein [Acidobacteriota bacterium]
MKIRAAVVILVLVILGTWVPVFAQHDETPSLASPPGPGESVREWGTGDAPRPSGACLVHPGETPRGLAPEAWERIQSQIPRDGSGMPAPDAISQTARLTAPDGAASENFGLSVSVNGGIAVVGAYNATVSGKAQQGAVYVYYRNQGGADAWGQVVKLTAADGAAGDQFGYAVCVQGDTLAVGATGVDVGANADQGAVYIFSRNQGGADAWGEVARFVASDGGVNESFGFSLSLDGGTVAVGTPYARVSSMGNRGAVYLHSCNQGGANAWGLVAKLTAADGVSGDFFGHSVSMDGDTVLSGALGADVGGRAEQGAAYIFSRNQGGADAWGLVKKLTAADGAAGDYFGRSVSLDGDTAVIGASGATVGGKASQGAAYVFYRNQGGMNTWGQVAKLIIGDAWAYEYLGCSVCVNGDTAVIGANRAFVGTVDAGAAFVYSRNWGGTDAWGLVKKLTAAGGVSGDYFGYSVCADGDTILVGAYKATVGGNANQGAAYLFTDPSICGDQVQKQVASDGAALEYFGYSVSVDGDTAVVGSPYSDVGGLDQRGAAYIFARNQGGADAWGQVCKLTASDGASYDNFGISVSVSGETAVVGAYDATVGGNLQQGAAYVFSRNQGGADNWGQVVKLTASDGAAGDYFGYSVSVDGDAIVIGAHQAIVEGRSSQGAAYIFSRNQGGADFWGQVKKLTASDGMAFNLFGISVSVSGDTALVGACYAPVGGNAQQGAAYLFSRNQGGADFWGQVKKLTASDGAAGDTFGISASVDGDTAVVGAYCATVGGRIYQGAAYVFSRNQGGADFWGQVKKLAASDGAAGDNFGISASVDGDTAVVGAYQATVGVNTQQGSAYLFSRNQGGTDNWGQVKKLAASDGMASDFFGFSASVDGDTAVAGAFQATVGGYIRQGAAYIFRTGPCPCAEPGLTANNTAADLDPCAPTGVRVAWPQDLASWGDLGSGTRTYEVLRNGAAIQAGIAYGTTNFTDTTGALGTSYTYAVRYHNGCGYFVTTAGADVADAPALSFTADPVPVSPCYGMSNGSITVNASGGTAPLSYSKDGTTYQASNVFPGLAAGSYPITVKDAHGCTQSATVVVSQPAELTASITSTNLTCYGASDGSITITPVSGGTPPFHFSIDGGVNYQVSPLFLNLYAANYMIFVKDDEGCMWVASTTLTQPEPVTLSPPTLPGGTANSVYSQAITASGGTGSYSFTVTAGTLPDGLSLAADGMLSGTPTVANTFNFTITATDDIGCTGVQTYSVTIGCPTVVTNLDDAGEGSLRWVVANACDGATITFAPGLTGVIHLTTGAVAVNRQLTIQGPGASVMAVDGGGTDRVFTAQDSFWLSGLTVRNGNAPGYGGGIFAQEDLRATECVISGNAAAQGGGGLFLRSGFLDRCTVSGNQVTAGGNGGGLLTGTSTGSIPQVHLYNSTISGNACPGSGGGIELGVDVLFFLHSCTVTLNTVGDPSHPGGGIDGPQASVSVGIINSIVAGNGPAASQVNLPNGYFTLGYNSILSGDPLLAPLGDYGGPTPTHAPLCGSPVLDTATPGGYEQTDQRLVPRPQGANADVGAVESSIALSPGSLPGGQTGAAYDQLFTAVGGTGPCTFTTPDPLPPGLTLATDGRLAGTPTALGSWTFLVAARDVNGFVGVCRYTLDIACPAITVTNPAVATGTAGVPFSQAFSQAGGLGSVTFTTGSTLPAGLTLASNGTLAGTPTVTGTFPITVTVTDSNLCTGTGPV